MKLRFTRPAARQLDAVLAHIAAQHPPGARAVQERIRTVLHLLLQYPYTGQAMRRPNVRRMVISPYPYAITYRVGEGEIVIRTVRHTARRPLA